MSITDRRTRRTRRGFTLVEVMFASGCLAVSVAALATCISAVYQHERYMADEQNALDSAKQLLEQITSLPVVADPGVETVASYNGRTVTTLSAETVDAELPALTAEAVVPAGQTKGKKTTPASAPAMAKSVAVQTTGVQVAGRTDNSGNLALITVTVPLPGGRTATVKRLTSVAEQREAP